MKKNNNEFLSEGIMDVELAAEQEEIKSRKLKYGNIATLFSIIFIIAVILINIFIGYMTERFVLEVDLTNERLFEISEDTKEVLADLDEQIIITVLADETDYRDSTELLTNIYETLQRYEALAGDKITVRYINPNLNPKKVEQYNVLCNVVSNDIIVESNKRYKRLSPSNLYSAETDDDGTTYYVGLRAEQRLTSSILFVTSDVISKAAYIRGHNEGYSIDELDTLLNYANYEVDSLRLATEDIPEDVTLIIIDAPAQDFTTIETAKLDDFFANGGDAIIALSPNVTEELTNLSLLFEEWGVKYSHELVFDSAQSISGYPMWVVPNVHTFEGITANLNIRNQWPVVIAALPIEITGTQTGSDTVTTLMSTSSTSYGKNIDALTSVYDKTEGDVDGPFNLMVLSERFVSDKNLNYVRSSIIFCSAGMMTDSILSESAYLNRDYMGACLNYVAEYTDGVIIADKNFASISLTILKWQANLVLWLVVLGIPCLIIIMGIVVWARRRHL